MIVTSSLQKYQTIKIKESLNTKIEELSVDGEYDYLPVPTITIVSPNGGEVFYMDSPVNIEWYTYGWQVMHEVDLYYTYDNGNTKYKISTLPTVATSSYSWNLNVDVTRPMLDGTFLSSDGNIFYITSSYKLIMSGTYEKNLITDISAKEFSIVTRSVNVQDFNSKAIVFGKENIFPIQWNSSGLGKYINIDLIVKGKDKARTIPIVKKYENPDTENYNWNVPDATFIDDDSFNTGVKVPAQIKVYDYENNLLKDVSNDVFVTQGFITNITGYKISLPTLDSINTQGIYPYKEYAIEILTDVGVAYYPRSYIELTGKIGRIYVKPSARFSDEDGNGIIIGEKFKNK